MTIFAAIGLAISAVIATTAIIILNLCFGMPTEWNLPLGILLGVLGGLITAITEPL